MAKLLNTTARVIAVGDIVLIPSVKAEFKLRHDDLAQYPAIKRLIANGDIVVEGLDLDTADITDQGDESALDFDLMTVAELKAYAQSHDIDLGNAVKKAEIIAVLKG